MSSSLPVIITPNAADDLKASWNYLRDRNPRAADEWLAGMRETILALGMIPEAHPIAPEAREFDQPIRRALYGKATRWRIYFAVIDGAVQVLHVRHGRRSDWKP
ncbi:MAG: type II toxin-antitoxin system RelE/ParE family toxin [Proteobacteria bacterium]|nr:type II toxin-antitoxin system RelE/ParE family toxin [Pseudomonadota bacterium]